MSRRPSARCRRGCTHREQSFDLRVAVVGNEVEMQAVLDRLALGDRQEDEPGKPFVVGRDHDLVVVLEEDLPAERLGPPMARRTAGRAASTSIVQSRSAMTRTLPFTGMDFTPREIDEEHARRYVAEGFWRDESLGELLAAGLHDARDAPVHRAIRPQSVPRHARRCRRARSPARDGPARARHRRRRCRSRSNCRTGSKRRRRSTRSTYLGAVVVPIVHFYGPKEVGYILRKTRVKALVTADRFGHQDFLANLAALRDELPDLEWVAVVGDAVGARRPCRSTTSSRASRSSTPATVDPRTPALVAYTSGTTSDPKGVVHSHRTINAEIHQLGGDAGRPRRRRRSIIGAPVGHGIGMLAALLIPVFRRSEVHLIDVWDPGRVLQAMLDDELSAGQGSTYFLTSLLDHPDFDPERHPKLMPFIGLGGSAVPAAVGERCAQARHRGRAQLRFDRTPVDHRQHARRRRTTSASPPTAGRCPASRSGSSTTTARTSRSAMPGEIWSRGPRLLRRLHRSGAHRGRRSAPTAGS